MNKIDNLLELDNYINKSPQTIQLVFLRGDSHIQYIKESIKTKYICLLKPNVLIREHNLILNLLNLIKNGNHKIVSCLAKPIYRKEEKFYNLFNFIDKNLLKQKLLHTGLILFDKERLNDFNRFDEVFDRRYMIIDDLVKLTGSNYFIGEIEYKNFFQVIKDLFLSISKYFENFEDDDYL
jgi:hypothetical protein